MGTTLLISSMFGLWLANGLESKALRDFAATLASNLHDSTVQRQFLSGELLRSKFYKNFILFVTKELRLKITKYGYHLFALWSIATG